MWVLKFHTIPEERQDDGVECKGGLYLHVFNPPGAVSNETQCWGSSYSLDKGEELLGFEMRLKDLR